MIAKRTAYLWGCYIAANATRTMGSADYERLILKASSMTEKEIVEEVRAQFPWWKDGDGFEV